MAESFAELQIEVAVLRQQLEGAAAEKALFKELLASKNSLLATKDSLLAANHKELQSLRASYNDDGGRPKRMRIAAEAGSACPLNKDEILDEVFSFVGLGEYHYVAGVSRRWRGRFIKLCYTEADADDHEKLCTSYDSALRTATRLQLALNGGLTVAALQENMNNLGCDIAEHSLEPIEVLKLAKIYDLPWSPTLASNAAFYNKLELLQWLSSVRCPWNVNQTLQSAAYRGSTELLDWLQSQVDKTALTDSARFMLNNAATYDNLEAVQWLRQHAAAEWGGSFFDSYLERYSEDNEVEVNMCWSKRTAQWALANGCTWGDWQCSMCSAERYTGKYVSQAAELFEWAHKNGCPCTCEQDAADSA
jgi:hypothetical protein